MWFLLAAGVRPKETKINLMDCICLCSEVEIYQYQLNISSKKSSLYKIFLKLINNSSRLYKGNHDRNGVGISDLN